jgi:hypothetical protein
MSGTSAAARGAGGARRGRRANERRAGQAARSAAVGGKHQPSPYTQRPAGQAHSLGFTKKKSFFLLVDKRLTQNTQSASPTGAMEAQLALYRQLGARARILAEALRSGDLSLAQTAMAAAVRTVYLFWFLVVWLVGVVFCH